LILISDPVYNTLAAKWTGTPELRSKTSSYTRNTIYAGTVNSMQFMEAAHLMLFTCGRFM
jgi:hypothetical protein